MNSLMISVSGIRGIFGDGLTVENAVRFAANFGKFCGGGTIVVGRDSRTSGPTLFQAVTAGLMGAGCNVIDLGIVSTPTVLLAVTHHQAQGGICLTASHNPAMWNAMKFVDANGMFLFPEKAAMFIASLNNEIAWENWEHIGSLSNDTKASRRHIDTILHIPYLDVEAIRQKKFRVVLDSVNGAGGSISPLLLSELGCEVYEINGEPSGTFAHEPEPLNHNLRQLEEAVQHFHADLGFATDPDVDRLSIVNEKGKCIGEEYSLALAEEFILPYRKGDLVTNLSTSMLSDKIAEKHGVKVHRTRVGEINVGKLMQELKSPVGGEGNGGVICPDVHFTRDAPAGMALILGLIARENKPLSEIVETLPKFYMAKTKVNIPQDKMNIALANVQIAYKLSTIDNTDGIKIIGNDYWIHIRKSGTEPIIRIYAESTSLEHSEQLCREAKEYLTY